MTKFKATLIILVLVAAAAFFLGHCTNNSAKRPEAVAEAYAPQTKADTVFITVTKLEVKKQTRIVSRTIPGATVYVRRDSAIFVQISADTGSAVIDSLRIPNVQTIGFQQSPGKATVKVTNSSPYIAPTAPREFRLVQQSRLGYGVYSGLGLAPNGRLYPTVGVGVFVDLRKRK